MSIINTFPYSSSKNSSINSLFSQTNSEPIFGVNLFANIKPQTSSSRSPQSSCSTPSELAERNTSWQSTSILLTPSSLLSTTPQNPKTVLAPSNPKPGQLQLVKKCDYNFSKNQRQYPQPLKRKKIYIAKEVIVSIINQQIAPLKKQLEDLISSLSHHSHQPSLQLQPTHQITLTPPQLPNKQEPTQENIPHSTETKITVSKAQKRKNNKLKKKEALSGRQSAITQIIQLYDQCCKISGLRINEHLYSRKAIEKLDDWNIGMLLKELKQTLIQPDPDDSYFAEDYDQYDPF